MVQRGHLPKGNLVSRYDRLRRLERGFPDWGGCRACPGVVYVRALLADLLRGVEPEVPVCPQCGQPPAVAILEVVVKNRADVKALQALERA
jgi:hypothetical protein